MAVNGERGFSGQTSKIDMTPLIDVLLVLLILFLTIQPALQKGIEVQVPKLQESASRQESPDQIVLTVEPGPRYSVNDQPVPPDQLESRIRSVFADRPRKVLFVKGSEDLVYGEVIAALDHVRGAGIEVIGLVPRERCW